MFAIAKGYPLGVIENKYIVGSKNGEKELSFQQAGVWMSFNGIKKIQDLKNDELLFNELISDGLLLKAQSLLELFEHLSNVIPMRQGAGTLKDNKLAIFIGEKGIYPTEVQYSIWRLADGNRKLSEIFYQIKNEYHVSVDVFVLSLSYLDENDLLHLV